MPLIGIGEYEPSFEQKVFGLRSTGEITAPFETSLGFHIVKKEGSISPDAAPDAEFSWKNAVETDRRGLLPKQQFEKQCLSVTGMKINSVDEGELWRYTDSFIVSGRKTSSVGIEGSTVLLELPDQKLSVDRWLEYAVQKNPGRSPAAYRVLYNEFVSESCMAYYSRNLEKFDPAFSMVYREFVEGNMLFDVMEKNVWNKASADLDAQKRIYAANSSKYQWSLGVDLISFSGDSTALTELRPQILKEPEKWRQLSETYSTRLMADSGRWEASQLPLNTASLKPGTISSLQVNEDGTASFQYVLRVLPGALKKSFDEARGEVINDLQAELEEKWVAELRKKYPVRLNNKVLQQVKKQLTGR